LAAAIDRELTGASRGGLAERAAAISAAYRGGGTSALAIRTADDALAYALVRLPATYAACAAVLAEARRRAPGFAPATLLDAGCGPGGGSWAAAEAWPRLERTTWLDSSAPFLALAARLGSEGPQPVRAAAPLKGDLTRGPFPRADLVIASYAFAELTAQGQTEALTTLWDACGGMLALVEPGTPAGYERILAARQTLAAAGAAILAPCPYAGPCPIMAPDWCHFSIRLPRRRDHRIAKGAEVPYEDEKYAYLLAARPDVQATPAAARVLTRPRAGKPGIELKLCTPEGLEARFVARRDKPAHARARRLDWGDAVT
jgi:ribosomal protein RSM22 (predicted rRNA methylase)